jgi:hypothetical protein
MYLTGAEAVLEVLKAVLRCSRLLEFGLGDWSWSLDEVDSDEDDRFF